MPNLNSLVRFRFASANVEPARSELNFHRWNPYTEVSVNYPSYDQFRQFFKVLLQYHNLVFNKMFAAQCRVRYVICFIDLTWKRRIIFEIRVEES